MQKFIITSLGELKYGDVPLHRYLLDRGDECIGGGVYEFDYASRRLLLSGKSYDYGRVKWDWLDEVTVPGELEGFDIYYEDLPLTDFVKTVRYKTQG